MIFGGSQAYESRWQCCITEQEVNAVHTLATPTWLRWSQTAITFNHGEHSDRVPHPGRYSIVVSPIIGTMRVSKVLMDGGCGLNILYASTLKRMGIIMAVPNYTLEAEETSLSRQPPKNHGYLDAFRCLLYFLQNQL
jgi:hypothetical protein